MNSAWDHDTECGASCSSCGRPEWSCRYMVIACDVPTDKHLCPECEPKPSKNHSDLVHSDSLSFGLLSGQLTEAIFCVTAQRSQGLNAPSEES